MDGNTLIGYLVYGVTGIKDHSFVCTACVQGLTEKALIRHGMRQTPVYRVNIGIYSQDCAQCGKMIVDGAKTSDGRPCRLFDGA